VYGLKTRLGAFLDPLADKLLLITAYILLAALGHVPLWLTVIVVARDMVILSGILFLYLNHRKILFSPSMLGKVTTFFQLMTILLVLLSHFIHEIRSVLVPLYGGTLLVTVGSCFHYVDLGLKMSSGETRSDTQEIGS
jgi:cardiolipin synthase